MKTNLIVFDNSSKTGLTVISCLNLCALLGISQKYNQFWCHFSRYLHPGPTMPPLILKQLVTTSRTSTSGWQAVTSTLRTWSVNRTTSSARTSSEGWRSDGGVERQCSDGGQRWGGLNGIYWAGFRGHAEQNRQRNDVVNLFQPALSFPECSLLIVSTPLRCLCSDTITAHRHTNALTLTFHNSALQSGLTPTCYFRFLHKQYASFAQNILLKWNTCLFVLWVSSLTEAHTCERFLEYWRRFKTFSHPLSWCFPNSPQTVR